MTEDQCDHSESQIGVCEWYEVDAVLLIKPSIRMSPKIKLFWIPTSSTNCNLPSTLPADIYICMLCYQLLPSKVSSHKIRLMILDYP